MIVAVTTHVKETAAYFGVDRLDGFIAEKRVTSTENEMIFLAETCFCTKFYYFGVISTVRQ